MWLELLEAEQQEIDRIGQWAQGMQQKFYSAKLPMGPIRKLAVFHGKTKIYFNTRTVVEPLDEVMLSTPIGQWAYESHNVLKESPEVGNHMTALCTLRLFIDLNKIFVQDAAAMMVIFPERAEHAIFNEMPCFQCSEFEVRKNWIICRLCLWYQSKNTSTYVQVYTETMKKALEEEKSPLDANLETVLPSVHLWHRMNFIPLLAAATTMTPVSTTPVSLSQSMTTTSILSSIVLVFVEAMLPASVSKRPKS
jgi:hypothetical protein